MTVVCFVPISTQRRAANRVSCLVKKKKKTENREAHCWLRWPKTEQKRQTWRVNVYPPPLRSTSQTRLIDKPIWPFLWPIHCITSVCKDPGFWFMQLRQHYDSKVPTLSMDSLPFQIWRNKLVIAIRSRVIYIYIYTLFFFLPSTSFPPFPFVDVSCVKRHCK